MGGMGYHLFVEQYTHFNPRWLWVLVACEMFSVRDTQRFCKIQAENGTTFRNTENERIECGIFYSLHNAQFNGFRFFRLQSSYLTCCMATVHMSETIHIELKVPQETAEKSDAGCDYSAIDIR